MGRKSKNRELVRNQNIYRLRELFELRPAALSALEVIELDGYIHLRLICEERTWDYWPSTNRAWEVGSPQSRLMSVDDLYEAVTTGIVKPEQKMDLGKPPSKKETRVLAWLERHGISA